jgi:hypothetical protein
MKKNILFALVFFAANSMVIFSQFSGGMGTEQSPYLISNIQDITKLTDSVNGIQNWSNGKYFKLVKNIQDSVKIVIGNHPLHRFRGKFDGGNHKLILAINNQNISESWAIGLFGYADSAVITGLTVEGYVKNNIYVGGIIGFGEYGCQISNCNNYAELSTNYSSFNPDDTLPSGVGGIIGYSIGGKLANCNNYGHINYVRIYNNNSAHSDTMGIGGIAGIGQCMIDSCDNYGEIYAVNNNIFVDVGGIAGIYCADITNCNNYANISGTCHVGGICGWYSMMENSNITRINIYNCINNGNIYCQNNCAGGIMGAAANSFYFDNIKVYIDKCQNSGAVTGVYAGGIVSELLNADITNCVNIGTIYASSSVGGIVAVAKIAGGKIANCINGGSLLGEPSVYTYKPSIGGILGSNDVSYQYIVRIVTCINVGVLSFLSVNNNITFGGISATSIKSGFTIQNCYYDKQMCEYGGINNKDIIGSAEGLLTRDIIGNNLVSKLGETNWTYSNEIYPIPIELDNQTIAFVAASPAYLNVIDASHFDRHNNLNKCFSVSNKNDILWENSNDKIEIVNNNLVLLQILGSGNLYAGIGEIKKTIPIKVNTTNECNISMGKFKIRVSENKLISPNRKNYQIPIYITASQNFSNTIINRLDVSINDNVFFPKSVNNGNISFEHNSDTVTIMLENLVVPELKAGIEIELCRIKGDAILGNTDSSEILIKNVIVDKNSPEFELINGYLTLEICSEGSDRLLNKYSNNPGVFVQQGIVSDEVVVKCVCIEQGIYALSLFDVLGNEQVIKKWEVDGNKTNFDFAIPIVDCQSGVYYFVMKTPNQTYSVQFTYIK